MMQYIIGFKRYFDASVLVTAVAEDIFFNCPSVHPSDSGEYFHLKSQKQLEGISSNLAQMSTWTQGCTN